MNTLTTESIALAFKEKHFNEDFVVDKSGFTTVEIINATFLADKPFILREPSEEYIARELEWYKSQSLNVNDIPGDVPSIWQQVASGNGYINSNYGFLVDSEENCDQFESCVNQLVNDPYSRRAIMIYTRPQMQYEFNKQGMNDFICTNNVQYFIRNGQLEVVVNMRSNDAVFGYNNDYAWQLHVQKRMLDTLNERRYWDDVTFDDELEIGNIYWNVGSMHVYQRHFNLLKQNQ